MRRLRRLKNKIAQKEMLGVWDRVILSISTMSIRQANTCPASSHHDGSLET
jgi:hypothetical protein